jgi:hypothetical protein
LAAAAACPAHSKCSGTNQGINGASIKLPLVGALSKIEQIDK